MYATNRKNENQKKRVPNRVVSSRPSDSQKAKLVSILQEEPLLVWGRLSYLPSSRHYLKRRWNEIAIQLNVRGPLERSGDTWKKYWDDLRSRTLSKYEKSAHDPRLHELMAPIERIIISLSVAYKDDVESEDVANKIIGSVPFPPPSSNQSFHNLASRKDSSRSCGMRPNSSATSGPSRTRYETHISAPPFKWAISDEVDPAGADPLDEECVLMIQDAQNIERQTNAEKQRKYRENKKARLLALAQSASDGQQNDQQLLQCMTTLSQKERPQQQTAQYAQLGASASVSDVNRKRAASQSLFVFNVNPLMRTYLEPPQEKAQ